MQKQKMKIAFFHNLPAGGARRVVYQQILYWTKRHDVTVFQIVNTDKDFLDFTKLQRITKTYEFSLDTKLPWIFKRFVKDYKNFISLRMFHKKIALEIDQQNYDIVIVHPDQFTQAPFLLRFLKTKNIYYCEEWLRIIYEKELKFNDKVFFLNKMYEQCARHIRKKIDKKNAQCADQIFTNSAFTAKNVEEAYKKKAIVCSPGVDTLVFKPLGLKKDYDILFIGERNSIDGFDLLESALKLATDKKRICVISKREKQEWITDIDLAKTYNKAKVVVALSPNEPFGLIPLEAMACGTPVVAIAEGGYKETIINKKTGLLIQRNAKKLYEAIQMCLSGENYRKMGKNAREHIASNWTIKKRGKALEDLLYEAI